LVVSVSAVGLVTMVGGALTTGAATTRDPNAAALDWILIAVLYWPMSGLFCSVLGSPFLLFQNWIVKPPGAPLAEKRETPSVLPLEQQGSSWCFAKMNAAL